MARIIKLKTFSDSRGCLTVIEKEIPFDIKRIFYIYDLDNSSRAGHRHKKNIQGLVIMNGACFVRVNNGKEEQSFFLIKPDECLILEPEDWHIIDFSKDAVLVSFCSENFTESDYIYDKYK